MTLSEQRDVSVHWRLRDDDSMAQAFLSESFVKQNAVKQRRTKKNAIIKMEEAFFSSPAMTL